MNQNVAAVQDLHTRLGFDTPFDYPESSLSKSLVEWKMETDDSPIFRYIYRNFKPRRHLEFGTWLGNGALYCLEESNATVWTINLYDGEYEPSGRWAYHSPLSDVPDIPQWAMKKDNAVQTDSYGFIGRNFHEKGLGHRVCQIYCDSRCWDNGNYPPDFFDTVLIDGGHTEDAVLSDTQKALQVLRSGGIIMWHDFCPEPQVLSACSSTRGVLNAIQKNWAAIGSRMQDIFWIKPSWILLGIKK